MASLDKFTTPHFGSNINYRMWQDVAAGGQDQASEEEGAGDHEEQGGEDHQ